MKGVVRLQARRDAVVGATTSKVLVKRGVRITRTSRVMNEGPRNGSGHRVRGIGIVARAEEYPKAEAELNQEVEGESELSESDRLRAQEKFYTIDRGLADCTKCGYVYDPEKGDPEYPLPPGMAFSELPEDWNCPFCGADKSGFESRTKKVAGFVQNQGYGFGNSMTGDEKLKLIYGSLLFFFFLFICGYAFN